MVQRVLELQKLIIVYLVEKWERKEDYFKNFIIGLKTTRRQKNFLTLIIYFSSVLWAKAQAYKKPIYQ